MSSHYHLQKKRAILRGTLLYEVCPQVFLLKVALFRLFINFYKSGVSIGALLSEVVITSQTVNS